MPNQDRGLRTPGSTGQIVAASVIALTGVYLCASAALDDDVVRAVVAGLQTVAGSYLLLRHVRRRHRSRHDPSGTVQRVR